MATQPNLITLSEKGFEFMTQPSFDSFHEFPYLDPGGVPTVGYGTVIDAAGMARYKDGIAKDHAKALFYADVGKIINQLGRCPFNGFQEWQFDAIISLCYNIGFGAFSTSTIYKQLMVRNNDLLSWLYFCKDNKDHVDIGLGRRRRLELKLFIYGLYS